MFVTAFELAGTGLAIFCIGILGTLLYALFSDGLADALKFLGVCVLVLAVTGLFVFFVAHAAAGMPLAFAIVFLLCAVYVGGLLLP